MKTYEVVVKIKLQSGQIAKATFPIMEESPDKAKAFVHNDYIRRRYSKDEFEIVSVTEVEEEA